MEFMFIATRVAFGQYFMQRCVAMKTLSQVWVFSSHKTSSLKSIVRSVVKP